MFVVNAGRNASPTIHIFMDFNISIQIEITQNLAVLRQQIALVLQDGASELYI